MSGQASAPSPSPPPRRSHGCLWGCLIVLLILCIPVGVAGWFFWQGFRSDPALRAATELVRRDGTAHRVLGDNIHIIGVEGRNFSYALGLYSESDYTVDLEGTLGQGTLEVRSHVERSGIKIDALNLTAPDGRRYDLMNHGLLPSRPGTVDDSI